MLLLLALTAIILVFIVFYKSIQFHKITPVSSPTNDIAFSCEHQINKIIELKNKEAPDEFIADHPDKKLLNKWKTEIMSLNGWSNEDFNDKIRFWGVNDLEDHGTKLFIGFDYIHDWIDVNANNYVDKQSGEPTIIWRFPDEEIISCDKAFNLITENNLPKDIGNISFYNTDIGYRMSSSPTGTKRPCRRGYVNLVTGEVEATENSINCPLN